MRTTAFAFVCVLLASPVLAQSRTGTDYQLRPLLHGQRGKGMGVALWCIAPDATATHPFRGLVVGGLLYKEKGRWLEMMGGTFLGSKGATDPALNVRALEKRSRVHLYGEAMYAFRAHKLGVSSFVNVPLSQTLPFGIGAEVEVFFEQRKRPSPRIGPRLVVPIPFAKKASLATAYQFKGGGGAILRQYLLVTF